MLEPAHTADPTGWTEAMVWSATMLRWTARLPVEMV
jgi:hypothetical protein